MDDEESAVSNSDLQDIGLKIVEAADRIRKVAPAVPGAKAVWGFELDDVRFEVSVRVAPKGD